MKITIFQDTYCPWCYVGKKNLETAVERFDGEVEIEYKSFFLHPTIPLEGMDKDEYVKGRYDPKHFNKMEKMLEVKAKQAGITMKFEDDQRIPNTELSHRLGKMYPEKKPELIQKYYEGYFEQSKDIGDIEVLLSIAREVGIDPEEARSRLSTDEKKAEVWNDYQLARRIGVQGVPFFVFNGEQAVQGAHEPDVLLQVMRRISAREAINLDLHQN